MIWDPPAEICRLPWIDHPVTWYGVLFALGFALGYLLLIHLLKGDLGALRAKKFVETYSIYALVGVVLGARIFHILFYEPLTPYLVNPLRVLMTWEGGLASHGGIVGLLVGTYCFYRKWSRQYEEVPFFVLLNRLVLPATLLAGFIRFGNLMNQEILGLPTTMPWAITMGHPADGSVPIARHPVQIYEMTVYWALLLSLWAFRHRKNLLGLFLTQAFVMRFVIEIFKEEQSIHLLPLKMGQILSIPIIIAGLVLSRPQIAKALFLKGSQGKKQPRN